MSIISVSRIWNQNKNGTGAMNTAKNDVFVFLLGWIDFWWEGTKIWWGGGEWATFLLVGGLPHSPSRENPVYFASRSWYTMKKLHAHQTHHVPKWSSYFCKIWALCVSQIYMVYIFTSLFSVCNTINLSHHEHEHVKSGPIVEEVSLKRVAIKHH